ncbi:MAG: hypothetical protein AAB614_01245 [Patescibacteria group bacterium]
MLNHIKNSPFLRDLFVWKMIFIGFLFNLAFYYYLKSESDSFRDGLDYASLIGLDYSISQGDGNFYGFILIIAIISIFNIICSRVIYNYDILASYILIISVPLLNILYPFSFLVSSFVTS